MNIKQKKALYESIMQSVAKTVKKALNEEVEVAIISDDTQRNEELISRIKDAYNKYKDEWEDRYIAGCEDKPWLDEDTIKEDCIHGLEYDMAKYLNFFDPFGMYLAALGYDPNNIDIDDEEIHYDIMKLSAEICEDFAEDL